MDTNTHTDKPRTHGPQPGHCTCRAGAPTRIHDNTLHRHAAQYSGPRPDGRPRPTKAQRATAAISRVSQQNTHRKHRHTQVSVVVVVIVVRALSVEARVLTRRASQKRVTRRPLSGRAAHCRPTGIHCCVTGTPLGRQRRSERVAWWRGRHSSRRRQRR